MGAPDPRIPAPPGAVPISGAVNPLNKVQAAPVMVSQAATPSLAALLGAQTPQPAAPTVPTDSEPDGGYSGGREWIQRKQAPRQQLIY